MSLLTPLLLLAFIITLFFTSKMAQVLRAERYQMAWILFTWMIGGILTYTFFLLNFDTPMLFISMLVILTFLYYTISGIHMGGSIAINITSLTTAVLFVSVIFSQFGGEHTPLIKHYLFNIKETNIVVNQQDQTVNNRYKAQRRHDMLRPYQLAYH